MESFIAGQKEVHSHGVESMTVKPEITLPPRPHQRAINFRFEKMLCVLISALTGVAVFFVSKDLLASLHFNYANGNWPEGNRGPQFPSIIEHPFLLWRYIG